MSQIVLILQLVLALLSNPSTAQNPQNQTLINQAVIVATQALASETSPTQIASTTVSYAIPTSTDNAQPVVIQVTNPTPALQGVPDVTPPTPQATSAPVPVLSYPDQQGWKQIGIECRGTGPAQGHSSYIQGNYIGQSCPPDSSPLPIYQDSDGKSHYVSNVSPTGYTQ